MLYSLNNIEKRLEWPSGMKFRNNSSNYHLKNILGLRNSAGRDGITILILRN